MLNFRDQAQTNEYSGELAVHPKAELKPETHYLYVSVALVFDDLCYNPDVAYFASMMILILKGRFFVKYRF